MNPFAESVNGVSNVGGTPLVHGKAGAVDVDDKVEVGSDEVFVDVVIGSPIHRRTSRTDAELSGDFISSAAEKMSLLGHVDTPSITKDIGGMAALGTTSKDVAAAEILAGEVSTPERVVVLV